MDASSGAGNGGRRTADYSRGFNEFFYRRREAEKPPWMTAMAAEGGPQQQAEDDVDEEELLDDAHVYTRSCSIDSSRTYSRTCSLESQESEEETETETVLRVAVCCASCENRVKSLTQLEGVSTVTVDRKTEKVTVVGTARSRDVLEACKKLFMQSKIWSPEDIVDDPARGPSFSPQYK